MTGTIKALTSKGETLRVTWDTERLKDEAVAEAVAIIAAAQANGEMVVSFQPGAPAERIFADSFDPKTHVDVAVVPRLVGG